MIRSLTHRISAAALATGLAGALLCAAAAASESQPQRYTVVPDSDYGIYVIDNLDGEIIFCRQSHCRQLAILPPSEPTTAPAPAPPAPAQPTPAKLDDILRSAPSDLPPPQPAPATATVHPALRNF